MTHPKVPAYTREDTTRNADGYRCCERDSYPQFQCLRSPRSQLHR